MDAAVQLIARQGYDATSVEAIAESADVARQTFFNYFPSKDAVVHAWVDQRRAQVREVLQADGEQDAVDRLAAAMRRLAAVYEADADTSRAMVRSWIRCGGPLHPDATGTADLFVEVLNAGRDAGQLDPALDPQVAAQLLLDAYLGVLYRWAAGGGHLHQQLEAAVSVLSAGLRHR